MTEGKISDDIQIALSELGVLTYRNNVGKAEIRGRWVAYGVGGIGASDLIAFYRGRAYFLEIKTPVGRLSPAQRLFQSLVERYGCPFIVLRSVDDARRWHAQLTTGAV